MPLLKMYTTSRGCYMLPTKQSHDYSVQSQQLLLGYILHTAVQYKNKGRWRKEEARSQEGGKGKEYIGEGWLFFKLSRKEKKGEERASGWQKWRVRRKGGGCLYELLTQYVGQDRKTNLLHGWKKILTNTFAP